MKKDNCLKKIVALMLVLILSVSQLSVVSYAQEDNFMEGFTSSDDLDEETDEAADGGVADDSGFSDGIDLSEMPQNENSVEASPAEEKKAEAHLTITPSEEKENTYNIEATWQITGAQDTDTRLALAMDKTAYAALPDTAKADSENICHIRAFDESGAEITLPMTLTSDENDSNLLRLVYTQSGNGTVQLSQTIVLEKCEEDGTSILMTQWYNDLWSTLATQEIQWSRSVTEETKEPDVTETPVPIADSQITGEPAITETPAAEETEVAEIPKDNVEEGQDTEGSEVTEAPETIVTPGITEIPEITETPAITGEPEVTETPVTIEETKTEEEENESNLEEAETSDIAIFAAENAQEPKLDDYITSITFRQKNNSGIWEEVKPEADNSYTFIKGNENLEFNIQYQIPAGVLSRENNTVTYDLPEGFKYADEDGVIVWGNGTAGTYTIKNGKVTLNFDPNSKFFDTDTDFTGYITFKSGVLSEKDDNKHEIKFSEKYKFDYTIKERENGGQVSKDRSFNAKKTGLELENHVLSYDVNVTPGTAGAENVIVKDKLTVTATSNIDASRIQFDDILVKDKENKELTRMDMSSLTREETVNASTGTTKTVYKNTEGVVIGTIERYTNGGGIVKSEITAGYYILERPKTDEGEFWFYLPDMASDDAYNITYKTDLKKLGKDFDFEQNYTVYNSVSDDHGWNEKTNDNKVFTNTWITKKLEEQNKNESGNYVLKWKVSINPEHHEMLPNDVFKDTLNVPSGIKCDNSKVTMVVKDESGTIKEKIEVDLSELQSENGITINDLLNKTNNNKFSSATNKYSIELSYSSTIENDSLPNGSSTITNRGDYNRGDSGNSSSASGTVSNELLKKTCDSNNVSFKDVTYTENGNDITERAIVIPWICTIKVPNTVSINDMYTDTFFNAENAGHLWTTPEDLAASLELTLKDGTKLGSDCYQLLYKTSETSDFVSATGKMKVLGYAIKFTAAGIAKIKGEKLEARYSLYGDYADIYGNGSKEPSRKYVNNAEFMGNSSSSCYEYKGSYFEKKLFRNNNGWIDGSDCSVKLSDLTNGRIKWRLETKLGKDVNDDVILTDNFPAGLELYSLQLTGNRTPNNNVLQGENGKTIADGVYSVEFKYGKQDEYSGTFQAEITTNPTTKEKTIRVTIPKEIIDSGDRITNWSNERWFALDIEAEIPEDADIKNFGSNTMSVKYTNHASLTVSGKETNEDSQETEITHEKKRLEKGGEYDSSTKRMNYELLINPKSETLLNGKTLTLEDVFTYDPKLGNIPNAKSVDLVSGSVKAYYYADDDVNHENKIYLPANGYDFTYQYEESDTTDGKKQNKLTMQLPDCLAVHVEYQYQLYSDQDVDSWSLSNTAELRGVERGSDTETKYEKYSTSGAGVTKNTINFYKVDSENYGATLSGAEFELTAYNSDTKSWEPVTTIVESEKGNFTASSLKQDVLYRLKETKAPLGYQKPTDGSENYYFYISDKTKVNSLGKPSDVDITKIHELSGGNTIYIPNESNRSISATKEWKNGIQKETVDLTLYKGYGPGYTYKDTLGENPKLTPVLDSELTDGQKATITLSPTGEQTATWHNLAETTSQGDKIYYYVFETCAGNASQIAASPDGRYVVGKYLVSDINNNGITHGEIILTNELKSISTEKVWSEGATPVDVILTLYRSTEANLTYNDISKLEKVQFTDGQSAEKKISANATGKEAKVTWNNLEASDSTGNIYYYYVFETKAGNASNPLYNDNSGYQLGSFHVIYDKNGILYGDIKITNEATKISVEKKWSDGAEHQGEEVKMQLYRSTTPPASKTESGETHNISVYYTGPNFGDYSYTNDSVIKDRLTYWKLTKGTINTQNDNLIIGDIGNANINRLNITCSDPNVIIFKKTKVNNNALIWKVKNISQDCIFYLKSDDSIWPRVEGNGSPTCIRSIPDMGIDLPGDAEAVSTPISLKAGNSGENYSENGWKYEWLNLPTQNNNGEKYYYYVKEVESEQYEAAYSYENKDGETKYVIINYPVQDDETSISVEKKWKPIAPENADISLKLYRDIVKRNSYSVTFKATFNGQPWKKVTYYGLEKTNIQYKVYLKWGDGNTAYNQDGGIQLNGQSANNNFVEMSFNNTSKSDITINLDFKPKNGTLDGDWDLSKLENGVLWKWNEIFLGIESEDFVLNSKSDAELVSEVSISAKDNWKKTWKALEKYDKNGNLYYYWVEESDCPDGYELYSSNNNEGISQGTIILTNAATSVDVKVTKMWDGYETSEYDNYKVIVQLQRTKDGKTEDVESTISLTKKNQWSSGWSKLDIGYTYSVKEIKVLDANNKEVKNFDTTYSTNALTTSGTITVTNTKKSQGITLPGTGGKDGWIFYGLGISFWAVSLSWLGLTFKKRKKSLRLQKEGQEGIP